MRKTVFRRIVLLLAVGAVSASAQQTAPSGAALDLTLESAIEIALSENPTVRVAEHEIEKQEYAKKGTLASLFPTVDFTANYSRAVQKQMMYLGGGMPGGGSGEESGGGMPDGIKIGRNNTWAAGFSAAMPIINAQLWKQLGLSADEVELAVEKSRSSRLSMVSQVRQAYYGVLLAEDSYDVFKESYGNSLKKYIDIKQKFEQGRVSEYDLIRADVAVKNIEPSLLDAQNAVMLAKWRLKALIGVDLNMEVNCAGKLSDYEDKLYADYMEVDTTMVAGNSTLRQLDVQRKQLSKARKIAQAAYYPTLNMAFSYQWNAMSENFKFKDYRWNPYSTLALSLNIPIFSGGKRYHNLKQTGVQMKQLELSRYDAERNLTVAVRQYVDKMKTGILQYRSASQGEELARKGYDIAVKRYDTGAGTLIEINDSQLALTQAQLNRNQAVYGFLVAKAMLDETMGVEEQ